MKHTPGTVAEVGVWRYVEHPRELLGFVAGLPMLPIKPSLVVLDDASDVLADW